MFLSDDDLPNTNKPVPLMEVNVPLHTGADNRLIGIAQFIIEGQSVAAAFSQLDQHLAMQGLIAFLVGGGILVIAIAWAFRRLRQAHHLLAERTSSLVRANRELALAAKSSAVVRVRSAGLARIFPGFSPKERSPLAARLKPLRPFAVRGRRSSSG